MTNTTTQSALPVPPSPHRPVSCPGGWLSGDEHDFDPHTEGVVIPWHVLGDSRKTVVVCAGCATPAAERHGYPTLDEMMKNEAWLGFGFLGAWDTITDEPLNRHRLYRPTWLLDLVAESIYTAAYIADWSHDDLFSWANSRAGRHFADAALFDYAGEITREDAYRQLKVAFTASFTLPEE